MSHNMRDWQGEKQEIFRRYFKEKDENKRYEEFEGMNYEQRRQSYCPVIIERSREESRSDTNDCR